MQWASAYALLWPTERAALDTGDIDGSIFSSEAVFVYQPWRHFNLGLGYRDTNIEVSSTGKNWRGKAQVRQSGYETQPLRRRRDDGLTPKRYTCQRENALGAPKPRSEATSDAGWLSTEATNAASTVSASMALLRGIRHRS